MTLTERQVQFVVLIIFFFPPPPLPFCFFQLNSVQQAARDWRQSLFCIAAPTYLVQTMN